MRIAHLTQIYPQLSKHKYKVVSYGNQFYNCLSLANKDKRRWWHHTSNPRNKMLVSYWPPDVPREWTLKTISLIFERQGYEICNNANYEEGFEKVAIYMNVYGEASHVAIMVAPGVWRSKLGTREEIEHDSLAALEGPPPAYGAVVRILKRPATGDKIT